MIIGLSGRKRSGKSTLGAALEKEFGFKQLAFASGVREFIAAAFGWHPADVFNERFKTELAFFDHYRATEVRGRELLQRIGTDAARKIFGEDCWVNVGMAKVADATREKGQPNDPCAGCTYSASMHFWPAGTCPGQSVYDPQPRTFVSTKHYVFTDVRFPNEVKAIQNAGGKVIRLNTAESVTTLHDYVAQYNDNCPETGECQYQGQEPDGNLRDCELPAAAHPCPFPIDRHVSECSLPDVGDYNLTLTGPLDVNTTAAVNAVKGWLAK